MRCFQDEDPEPLRSFAVALARQTKVVSAVPLKDIGSLLPGTSVTSGSALGTAVPLAFWMLKSLLSTAYGARSWVFEAAPFLSAKALLGPLYLACVVMSLCRLRGQDHPSNDGALGRF